MAKGAEQKWLRIGLVKDGITIGEKLIKDRRGAVTIGSANDCTFRLLEKGLPPRYKIFEVNKGKYTLIFNEKMKGIVAIGSQKKGFKEVISGGLAQQNGSLYRLTLDEQMRGKISIGPYTMLFQFYKAPPPKTKTKIPPELRRKWVSESDLFFVLCLSISFFAQTLSVIFVTTREYPPSVKTFDVENRFVQMLEPEKPKVEQPPDEEPKVDDAKDTKPDKVEKEEKLPEPTTVKNKQKRKEILTKKVRNSTILKYLASGTGEDGVSIVGELSGEAARVSMDQAFDGVGVAIANSDNSSRAKVAGASVGDTMGIDESKLATKKGGRVKTKKKRRSSVKGKLNIAKPSEAVGTGSLSQSSIARTVNRKKRSIQACYENELKKDSSLRGKIKVQFTIEPSGRVNKVKIIENRMNSNAVGQCITKRIRRWRFEKPSGGSVTISYPFLFNPSN